MPQPFARAFVPFLLAVVAAAGCDKLGLGKGDNESPTAPTGPPAAGTAISYAALGASDVTGLGSSVPCIFSDCPDGTGYVFVAARQLRAQGYTVSVSNVGLPSAVISRAFQMLAQQYGRTIPVNIMDQGLPFVPGTATLVTLFTGVNDVNVITGALGAGFGGNDPSGYIDTQVRNFGSDYTTIISGIKSRAPNARIIALNVPNVAGLPSLANASAPQRQAAQRASVGMARTVINALTAQGVTVVDLMCDSRSYLASNYSSDGLHPNDSGYAFIGAEVARAVTTSYPAPNNTCAQMTIVP
jgi:lysophospholipase L1-like esterase